MVSVARWQFKRWRTKNGDYMNSGSFAYSVVFAYDFFGRFAYGLGRFAYSVVLPTRRFAYLWLLIIGDVDCLYIVNLTTQLFL